MSNKLSEEFIKLQQDIGIIEEIICDDKEKAEFEQLLSESKELPEGVYADNVYNTFSRNKKTTMANEEIQLFVMLKQESHLRMIKRGVIAIAFLLAIMPMMIKMFLQIS